MENLTLREKYDLLTSVKRIIEDTTDMKWRITSFVRNSPSHRNGNALDIAPDIDPRDAKAYAAFNHSDPILTKRAKLIRKVRDAVKRIPRLRTVRIGVFIETDHLHIGIFKPDGLPHVAYVWEQTKEIYPDTEERHRITPFETMRKFAP